MKQGSIIAARNLTVQRRTFGYLRRDLKAVIITVDKNTDEKDPRDWDKLLLGVIENQSKAPIKFKLPQIDIILTEFKNLPITKTSPVYLSRLYDIASRRRHQGRGNPRRFGTEAWFMKYAYCKLFTAVDDKLDKIANSDDQARPRSQIREPGEPDPVQTELPLEVHPASQ